MHKKFTTSIVIRALNEGQHLGKLLYGLQQQTKLPDEIILVDSGSTDDTLLIAGSYDVRIEKIEKSEFTFGRSLNIGCSKAKNEILVFLSAHVYPSCNDWLLNICKPFEEESVACSYGKQRGNYKTKYSEKQVFLSLFPDDVVDKKINYFCNNANCAIRRSEWLKQSYDETLTGLEDLDWAKKQYISGRKIVYVPDAEIIHVHDENWNQIRNRYRREAFALRKIEPKMSMSLLNMIYLFLLSTFSDYFSIKSIKSFKMNFFSIILFRFNQYYGTWIGLNKEKNNINELRTTFYYPPRKSSKKRKSENLFFRNKKDKNSKKLINYESFRSIIKGDI